MTAYELLTADEQDEYRSAADWCAARGLRGRIGDRLPDLLSARVHAVVSADPEAFEDEVTLAAYARVMGSKRYRYPRVERRHAC